jgi:beta-phosphoglucomutase-like phosphatase (HAD superfamily)
LSAPGAAAAFAASIFDMDGLLIDSEILWHEAEIDILGGLGVPLAADGCRGTKGMFVGEVTEYRYRLHCGRASRRPRWRSRWWTASRSENASDHDLELSMANDSAPLCAMPRMWT